MTRNYFKGKITVVFPATQQNPLYGKILPIWGLDSNKSDQINFNQYALKENPRFPEEGGQCEIDYKDTRRWTKKVNSNVEFYTPNVPFIVYFKIKATKQRDGSTKLVAVSLYAADKINLQDKMIADNIKRQPSMKELLGETKISPIEALEMGLGLYNGPYPKNNLKKSKSNRDVVEELDLDDEADALEAALQQEWSNQKVERHYSPVNNLPIEEDENEEEVEENPVEEILVDEEEEEKYFRDKKCLHKMKAER